MNTKVQQAFLNLISHGSDLLHTLQVGDVPMAPNVKTKVDGFKGALSQATDAVRYLDAANAAPGPQASVFDGGPPDHDATPPVPELSLPEMAALQFAEGEQLAREAKPLPDSASPDVRHGYESILPPKPAEIIQPSSAFDGGPDLSSTAVDAAPEKPES